MQIKDIYPLKAQFDQTEPIQIKAKFETDSAGVITLTVTDLNGIVFETEASVTSEMKETVFSFSLTPVAQNMKGYLAAASFILNGTAAKTAVTAFDRVSAWKDAPRYGFLSEFGDDDRSDDDDIAQMNKYHLSIVQFYDWMYRHAKLFPPKERFSDPFGRQLSMTTVRHKIDLAHKYGMKTFAYGAVYGAQEDYFKLNQEYGLFQNDGIPTNLGHFLFNMDINKESKWHDHIISEFSQAIDFGFDGIHMDQYGTPKEAVSNVGGKKAVRALKTDFFHLINDTKKELTAKGQNAALIFNAVNNWPIEAVANSEEDAVYIEVWPPNDTYDDLNRLITDAKKLCKSKQVILAAYMSPFGQQEKHDGQYAENATLLTSAVIFASGGFHLLLGENNGVLKEAYYVKYAKLQNDAFIAALRRYYDFITAYEELLYDEQLCDNTMTYTGGINDEFCFIAENSNSAISFFPKAQKNSIFTVIKDKPGYKIIHLLNYVGIDNMNWNKEKPVLPTCVTDIRVTALIIEEVKGVYLASPDMNSCVSEKLKFDYTPHAAGKAISFTVPKLHIWDMIYIEIE